MQDDQGELLTRVVATIKRHALLEGGEKVIVAVSGGADSLGLLHLLYRLRERYALGLYVGHINHLMRGEAAADAAFVEETAGALGIKCFTVAADVRAQAKARGISIEEAGRQARYAALEEMAQAQGASRIALGHTADDQVETVLLNFLRGGGAEGLAGMPIRRELAPGVSVIRPLLEVTKAQCESYCKEAGLEWRLDATNLESFALRNRLRRKIMPLLREEQPALGKVLLRQAEIFREEDRFLRGLTEAVLEEVTEKREPRARALSVEKLAALPPALARRAVREVLRDLREGRLALGLEQVERVLELAGGETGKYIEVGDGIAAEKEYGRLIIGRAEALGAKGNLPSEESRPAESALLAIPGEVEFGGVRLRATRRGRAEIDDVSDDKGGRVAFLDGGRLAGELAVRYGRAGDRFRPLGAPGRMKLSDFFTNAKVPRKRRAKTVVLCRDDEIVWVVGFRIDEGYKVGGDTREIVRVEIVD